MSSEVSCAYHAYVRVVVQFHGRPYLVPQRVVVFPQVHNEQVVVRERNVDIVCPSLVRAEVQRVQDANDTSFTAPEVSIRKERDDGLGAQLVA